MKPSLLLAALAAAVFIAVPTGAARTKPTGCEGSRQAVVFFRDAAWNWEARHDANRTPGRHAESSPGCRYVRWAAIHWRARARAARTAYEHWFAATYAKYLCIHEHEGAWSDDTGNGYDGGLQFDGGFQVTYGSEFLRRYGPAGKWPVWAQLVAAERAFHGYHGYGPRGYGPWGTAPGCGL